LSSSGILKSCTRTLGLTLGTQFATGVLSRLQRVAQLSPFPFPFPNRRAPRWKAATDAPVLTDQFQQQPAFGGQWDSHLTPTNDPEVRSGDTHFRGDRARAAFIFDIMHRIARLERCEVAARHVVPMEI
jgi:hypothetical protein